MPISIGREDSPRFSFDGFGGGSSPSFTPSCGDVCTLRSFSYLKIPQLLFKLSILKLDGSSFDVQVARTASVSELKQEIEDFFNSSPKEGRGQISWSHVWGHFCLCFQGQRLVNDKAYIKSFGIKDGDQICFIRNLSIDYNPMKKSKSCKAYYEQETSSSSGWDSLEEEEQHRKDDEDYGGCYGDQLNSLEEEEQHHKDDVDYDGFYGDQEGKDKYFRNEDGESGDIICQTEFKLANFLKGWLLYSKLLCRKQRPNGKAQPSRFAGHYVRVETKASLL